MQYQQRKITQRFKTLVKMNDNITFYMAQGVY